MLWSRNKPLNQPPSYGHVGYHAEKKAKTEAEKAANRAINIAQLDRECATLRHGGRRAVVKD